MALPPAAAMTRTLASRRRELHSWLRLAPGYSSIAGPGAERG